MKGRFLFIGGLHRSGTSALHRVLREHPRTSGFRDTGKPEDEGQHLQSVFPAARAFGGPGRFAFDARAHMTEASPKSLVEERDRILADWSPHYDADSEVLLEKSPPNLIRARYLQALFPDACFVFLVRHPIAVAMATQKWSKTSIAELLLHWHVAHCTLLEDLRRIDRYELVRYEDLTLQPQVNLDRICQLMGIDTFSPREVLVDHNDRYLNSWAEIQSQVPASIESILAVDDGPLREFGYTLSIQTRRSGRRSNPDHQ